MPSPAPVIEEEEETGAQAVSDASPAEERVMALMRELLGPERLSRNSDFFLSGGDSLLAIRLASRIADVFGIRLARKQLMQARTPAKIAALLGAGGEIEQASDKAEDCVVCLAKGNNRLPPIVLIHAVGGGIFIYRELLQALSTAHPVYGLQAPGLWDDAAPIDDLLNQAEHYHACLLRAGVENPVMLGGSSYGGLVAYELDRLYRQSGHRTSFVTLFDSPGPGHMPERLESEAEICAYMLSRDTRGRDFAADLARMRALDHEGRFALLLDYMRETLMPHASAEDVERQVRVFRQNLLNMWNWVPRPHDARIFFCKAKEHAALLANDPELAWVPLAGAGIEILPVPGDHSSMLSFPHVRFVANEVNRRLSMAAVPQHVDGMARAR
jgi:thioesterase domain-containing protein/acyl carrier protein